MSDERAARLEALLAETVFAGAARTPVSGDASTRSYERLELGGRSAILMNAPPRAESAPCPPGASPAERAALGYNAVARLAASRVEAFAALAAHLRALGLSAPEIYGVDVEAGYCVLEDMGAGLYWSMLGEGADPAPLYEAATDALVQAASFPAPGRLTCAGGVWRVLEYDHTAMQAEAALLPDWFLPHQLNRPVSDEARAEWTAAWETCLAGLDDEAPRLVLRDYHSPNLMWLPQRSGQARAGVLDFQDALAGHPAYDVASLLEDARRDVPPEFAEIYLARYIARSGVDAAAFRAAYAILAAQRNAKIIGVFARLKYRDGKPHYIRDHQPRVIRYFRRNLEAPALAPVAAWFARHAPLADWASG
ncbi:MAG: phosphotransferase [Alphaproteobacteria bacterium]|nr:phosphotransferase [Alphaproteobacteria bacterium]